MKENVGELDRWARVAVGTALSAAGIRKALKKKRKKSQLAPAALFAGGAFILESALTRVCPINAMLGIDTRKRDRKAASRDEDAPRDKHVADDDGDDVAAHAARIGESAAAAGAH